MPIVKAKDPQRVNMRREQIERFLASSSTVSEWCALNKVSESTLYKWMAYFREMEPESFGSGSASRWIEVSRTVSIRSHDYLGYRLWLPAELRTVAGGSRHGCRRCRL